MNRLAKDEINHIFSGLFPDNDQSNAILLRFNDGHYKFAIDFNRAIFLGTQRVFKRTHFHASGFSV